MIFCKDRRLTREECIILGFFSSCRQCDDVLDADKIKKYTRYGMHFCSSKCYVDWVGEGRRNRRRFYVATR